MIKFAVSDPAGWSYSKFGGWEKFESQSLTVRVGLWRDDRLVETRLVRCGWWFAWRLKRTKRAMLRQSITIARGCTDVFLTPKGYEETQSAEGQSGPCKS